MATASSAAGLTDTDILIDAARGLPDAIAFLSSQRAGAGISISIISSMELVAGCRDAAELRQIQQFLLLYPPQGEKGPPRIATVLSKQTLPQQLLARTLGLDQLGSTQKSR